jgi:putative oxidoreductase
MQDDLGKLVARLSVGGLLLFHGIHKLLYGIADVQGLVVGHHLPAFVAYGVYVGEIVAPAMVILGLFSRIGGLVIAVNMVFAIVLAGMGMLGSLNEYGGYALELEVFYLLGGLTVALLGAGKLSLNIGGELN